MRACLAPVPMADVLQLALTNSASLRLNAPRTIATTTLVGTVVSMKSAAIHRIAETPIPVRMESVVQDLLDKTALSKRIVLVNGANLSTALTYYRMVFALPIWAAANAAPLIKEELADSVPTVRAVLIASIPPAARAVQLKFTTRLPRAAKLHHRPYLAKVSLVEDCSANIWRCFDLVQHQKPIVPNWAVSMFKKSFRPAGIAIRIVACRTGTGTWDALGASASLVSSHSLLNTSHWLTSNSSLSRTIIRVFGVSRVCTVSRAAQRGLNVNTHSA